MLTFEIFKTSNLDSLPMVEKTCITCQTLGSVSKYMSARFYEFSMNIFWVIKCIPGFCLVLYSEIGAKVKENGISE
jgi:nucleoside recognition membrane protein YjiH